MEFNRKFLNLLVMTVVTVSLVTGCGTSSESTEDITNADAVTTTESAEIKEAEFYLNGEAGLLKADIPFWIIDNTKSPVRERGEE